VKWILIIIAIIAGVVAIMTIIAALLLKRPVASQTAKFSTDAEPSETIITDFAAAPS
jgi:flagellar basal body-associated protein FliL